MQQDNLINRFLYLFCFVFILIVYIIGLHLRLMRIDATTYAAIAKEMYHTKNYLQIYYKGDNYLDKPPLLFWTAVASYHLFGIKDYAYRLPSFLVTLLGLYSLYRFTLLYYSRSTAKAAMLIAACCQAYFLMNHDVKTDTLLTGFTVFAFWQLGEFFNHGKLYNILLGATGIGLAMLSKGPIGLIMPIVAFGGNFIIKREWKNFFRWQYIPAVLIILIVLLPFNYGLYEQYDAKGKPSGLLFFYWTNSFGRITGSSDWNNRPGYFFLSQSFMWSFLPWSVLFPIALFMDIRKKLSEYISTCGFLFMLIFFSLSRYQLPHYTFIIHPFAAVITANFLISILPAMHKLQLWVKYIQFFLVFIFMILSCYLSFIAFETSILIKIILTILYGIALYFLFGRYQNIIISGVIAICAANLLLNTVLYPNILKYESEAEAAKYLNTIGAKNVIMFTSTYDFALDFYFNGNLRYTGNIETIKPDRTLPYIWVFTNSDRVQTINDRYRIYESHRFYEYPVSKLTYGFINPDTRLSSCDKVYLLKVGEKQ